MSSAMAPTGPREPPKRAPARRRPGRRTSAGDAAHSARARAKAETREALIQAAIAEFAGHGLDAPSLDAICARAGFTRGAFYVHFEDRDDLVVAVMERVFAAFLDAMVPAGAEPQDLERTVRRYADTVAGLAELRWRAGRPGAADAVGVPFHRLLEACARSPALRGRFVALLQRAGERLAGTAA